MNYNTDRPKLELSEYGRHVQGMIEYICTIEDDAKRNEQAKAIIELMGQMNPHLRNVEEFRHKLWDHIVVMSDFKLKVDSPYPQPEREAMYERPKPLPYPQTQIVQKNYGKNVEAMINKAIAMDDLDKKRAYAEVIGNYMKLVHNNWNNESVNNELIYADLERMSGGQLILTNEANLDLLAKPAPRQPQQEQRSGGGGKNFKKHGQNKGNGGGQNQGGGGQNKGKNFKKRHGGGGGGNFNKPQAGQ